MILADRVSRISLSPTVAVKQQADRLKKQGADIIDLGPGEPDFATPQNIAEAGIGAIRSGFTHYTATAGTDELRDAVARRYEQMGSECSRENVIISCGAKHALFNAFMALFEEGDEVLVFCPYWVTFPDALRLVGAQPVFVETRQEENFEPRIEDVESHITEKTRGIIVNSPNNPSGAVYSPRLLEALVALAAEKNLNIISDETYEFFTYEGARHCSLATFMKPDEHGLVVASSFSKGFAMTGWRVGFCVSHPDLIRQMISIQSHMTTNPCSISQMAALEAMDRPEVARPMLEAYTRRRRLVLNGLNTITGFKVGEPLGSFYVFPNVESYLGKRDIDDSVAFANRLLQDVGVAVVPGAAFGTEGHIRISYATSEQKLEEALRRLSDFASQLMN